MSSAVNEALHTAVTSQGSLKKNFNNNIIDLDLPDNINSTVCNSDVVKRYNRSKLVAIRQGVQSRCCPNSNIKADLKFLGIWKINNSGNLNQKGTRSSIECFNLPGAFDQAVHIQPARPNTRRYRSPSKQEHRLVYNGSNSSQQNLLEHNISKTFIDHRSISSSHLMPAFAKKKMVASTMNAGMTHTKASLNSTGIGLNSLGGARSQTPTDYKNGIWYSSVSGSTNVPPRHRVKSRSANGFEILGEYDHEREQNEELYGQSAVTAGSRHNRIGSGRLIPSQVNWETHTIDDNEKILNSKISFITDEDAPPKNHFGPHEKSLCVDRRLDRNVCSEYMNQGTFDRCGLSGEEHSNDFYVRSNNTKTSKAFITRVTKENISKLEPSSVFHRNTRNYQYNERTEEPEWFSGGPTSQNDTIELRGFEEFDELYNIVEPSSHISQSSLITQPRRISPSPRRNSTLALNNSKSREVTHTSKDQGNEANRCSNISPNDVSTGRTVVSPKSSNSVDEEENNFDTEPSHIHQPPIVELSNILLDNSTQEGESNLGINNDQDLNFDVFLNPNLDPLKHSLMRGDNSVKNQDIVLGSSKFSRWFGNIPRDNDIQPSKSSGNGNSTITDASEKSFSKSETNTLLEFLNKLPTLPDFKPINKATNITSVEELEASMRASDTGKKDSFKSFIDISSKSTEKEVKSIDIGMPTSPDQACETPEEGEVQAFKKLLQKLGSGNMQDRQQKTHFKKILPATNLQTGVSNSPKTPFKSLKIIEAATTSGRSHFPQYMVLKNDEVKNFAQLQFNPQHQNNGDFPFVPISQPEPHHLSVYLAREAEKHSVTNNLYKCAPRSELSIHLLEEEIKDSYVSQHGKEVTREMTDIERCTSIIPQLSLSSSADGPERSGSPLICRNSDLSIANPVLSNESYLHHVFEQNPSSNIELRERCPLPPHFHPLNRQIILGQREFQFHTQTVMQNAIWKNKVEDHNIQQKDINRRRQETQRQQQPNKLLTGLVVDDNQQKTNSSVQTTNSAHRQLQQTNIQLNIPQQISLINSLTPLAFTPTSVLRKMTADRDSFNASSTDKYQSVSTVGMQQKIKGLPETTFVKSQIIQQQMSQATSQPRMILGGKLPHLQQACANTKPSSGLSQSRPQSIPSLRNTLAPAKWSSNLLSHNMSTTKPMGRPILKGPLPPQSTKPQRQSQDQISECMLSKLGFQQIQQQRLKSQRQPLSFPQSTTTSPSMPSHAILATQVQQQQVYQQRALALQRHQHQFHVQQKLNNQQHEQPIDIFNHNICMISPLSSDTPASDALAEAAAETARIHYQREGELSATSNQLAQWFSPELLAQATAGKLPLLNMNQALSLEEFERNMQHSSTRVHN